MKLRLIVPLFLLLPLITACNQGEDVVDILTGKRWKLRGIFFDNTNPPKLSADYWDSMEAKEASDKLFDKAENFVIGFSGIEDGDIGKGEYSGRAANNTIKGNWQANGKNNSFTVTNQAAPGNGEDILGQAFIHALIHAEKYEGDNYTLRIYFKDKDKGDRRYLLFHVVNF